MNKLLALFALLAVSLAFVSKHAIAENCEFQMADMNWPSATLMANVDKFILGRRLWL